MIFIIGFIAVMAVGFGKLYDMTHGNPYRLVTDSPYFYLALTMMPSAPCSSSPVSSAS